MRNRSAAEQLVNCRWQQYNVPDSHHHSNSKEVIIWKRNIVCSAGIRLLKK
ncbi:hypothetical protein [Xylanibacillus composti]|uniref:hypothetical protein n=1 Tax=Xylanibacillus composti TaxID=1572762 RepID=UPI001BD10752|nr:hypothetical protein [Xylanibacillus composti]